MNARRGDAAEGGSPCSGFGRLARMLGDERHSSFAPARGALHLEVRPKVTTIAGMQADAAIVAPFGLLHSMLP